MKVMFCAYDRPNYINGPNVWLQRLLPELRARSVEVKILFLRGNDNPACPTLSALRLAGFTCESFRGLPYTEHQLRWILERVQADPPDVFVPNLVIPAYFASQWIKAAGIPTVGVLHSDDPFYRAILDSYVNPHEGDYLSVVVAVSRFLESMCLESRESQTPVRFIPYGVPVPERAAKPPDIGLSMVYSGRLVDRQKRITDTVRALCQIARALPTATATLFGSGPLEAEIRAIIHDQGCAEAVKLGGLIEPAVLQERML